MPASRRPPRTGRRPGRPGTREQILEAARRRFADGGYEATSLRAVAGDAGVDPALVIHYFGTKAGLLAAAVRWPFDPAAEVAEILRAGPDAVGERLVRLFVRTWEVEGDRDAVLTVMRTAVTDPTAAALLRTFMAEQLFTPVVEALELDEPQVRVNLVASQLLGLGMARYVVRFEPLASLAPEKVVAWVAPTLQRYLAAGPAPAAAAPGS